MEPFAVKEIQATLTNTLNEMALVGKDIEEIKSTQQIMAKSHEIIAEAAKQMSETFRRAEIRQENLELTNRTLYKEKGVSPNVFFLVTGTLCAVIILGAVWITDTSVKATLTSFEAGRKQAEALSDAKHEIIAGIKDGR